METFLIYKQSIISELEDYLDDYEHDEGTIENIFLQAISGIKEASSCEDIVTVLNKLLVTPNHFYHQRITRLLQQAKNPSSIPYIRYMLESGFDFLEYTCSDSGVIAKWFSWVLASIGTEDAINLIKEYTHSEDEGIRDEMIYRLKRIEQE